MSFQKNAADRLLKLILFLGLINCGCEKSQISGEKTLRLTLDAEPPSLDSVFATDMTSISVIGNLMEGLARFDKNLEPIPAMAESWKVSSKGMVITFYLREDAFWSDGKPVTASDFEYSWKRLLSPLTASQYAYFLFEVKNAFEYNSGKHKNANRVGIKALAPKILQVKLKRPVSYFPSIVTFTATFPQRRDIVEQHGDHWTDPEFLIVNGPFTLIERKHEYKLTLRANPRYYGGKQFLDRVIFYIVEEANTALALYETGQTDLTNLPLEAVPSYRDHPEYVSFEQFNVNYYGFNVHKVPFDNVLIRQAFAHSIERSRLPKVLQGGQQPMASWVPKGMFGHSPTIGAHFNPVKARSLLSKAGYPKGRGLPKITIVYNSNINNRLVAEFLQAQWKQHLGVETELDSMEWKVFLNRLKIDPPQLFRGNWVADFPDPETFMNLFVSTNGNNRSHWDNQRYDQLITRAAVESDPELRRILYDEAQVILTESETAIIPLFSSTKNQLVKPYVKGYRPSPMGSIDLKKINLAKS